MFGRFSVLVGFVVLLVAATLSLIESNSAELRVERPLARIVSPGAGVWRSEEIPLGDTEQLKLKVERVLRFDDVLFRRYFDGKREFSLYIAYWRPGSVPPREVTFHTPDRCWVHAGWTRVEVDIDYILDLGTSRIAPIQWRVFEAGDRSRQNVVFWHVVDGQITIYNALDAADDVTIVTDLLKYGIRMKREQFFIRISSPDPFSDFAGDPFFKELVRSLVELSRSGS